MTTAEVDALRRVLLTERTASYGYGIVGPRVTPAEQQLARGFEAEHRQLAASIEDHIAAAHSPVPPAAPEYALPVAVTGTITARRLGLELESNAASAWRYLVAMSAPATSGRALAQSALTASAVRAARWRAKLTPSTPSVPFPGIAR